MKLSKAAWNKMVKLIENPPVPTPAMRRLMKAVDVPTPKPRRLMKAVDVPAPRPRRGGRTDAIVAEALAWLRTPGVS